MSGVKKQGGDVRVARVLESNGIQYEINDDGDFHFGFILPKGRSQAAFVGSKTFDLAGVEMRELYSVGLRSFGAFDSRTANILLKENSQIRFGAWCVHSNPEGNHLAVFCANIAADSDPELLLAAIQVVVVTADAMEERLSGMDEF